MDEVSVFHKYKKPNGAFIFTDTESGKVTEFHSLQCCHCGIHWQYEKGSGRLRGFCFKCMGYLCGQELCMRECVPMEAQLELQEGNRKAIMKYKDTKTAQRLIRDS